MNDWAQCRRQSLASVEQANSLFRRRLLAGATVLLAVAIAQAFSSAGAQDASTAQPTNPIEPTDDEQSELKPTEIGIRFTPQMAAAMGKKFVEQMKSRYGLDEQQADDITQVMQRQLMQFASENAVLGRDMIEMMMATMVEHDGRFPKDEAKDFAKLANRFTPKLKDFVTRSSGEIGKKMSMTQRLKYTADVGLFAAGLMTFENRMKRWEEGKIGDNANPFFDPADSDPAKAEAEPINPNETATHRRARKDVEQWIDRTLNRDKRWSEYVDHAAKYYDFSETQITSARAILKDCQQRAAAIRTAEWQNAVKEVRIVQQLSYSAGEDLSQGPWGWSLSDAESKLLKPMDDLADELKRRIDDLPDSTQRAAAREKVRKALAEKGAKQLPT